jgi:uncharacterized phage-associated protein
MKPIQFNREKLKAAVWLIASHCPPEEMGNVKMHKTLYFADMMAYLNTGEPITGVEYQKQKFGPTARYLTSAIQDLEKEGKLLIKEENYFGFMKKKYVVIAPYQTNQLGADDERLLREVADYVRGKSAREISEISHNAAWEAAEMGESIPYFTALRLIPVEVTESDRQWARDTALNHATERPF